MSQILDVFSDELPDIKEALSKEVFFGKYITDLSLDELQVAYYRLMTEVESYRHSCNQLQERLLNNGRYL